MTLNDINTASMSLYRWIQRDPGGVTSAVGEVDAGIPADETLAREYSYALRGCYNELTARENYGLESNALMLFLNKHCLNGLYRVNSKGQFNVPFNGSLRGSSDEDNIRAVSQALWSVTLLSTDFEQVCAEATEGDFMFLDSPHVLLKTDTLQGHTKEDFSLGDHERLVALFRELHKRSCFMTLTNRDTPLIREFYARYHLEVVSMWWAINSDATKRSDIEVIIIDFEEC